MFGLCVNLITRETKKQAAIPWLVQITNLKSNMIPKVYTKIQNLQNKIEIKNKNKKIDMFSIY